MCACVYECKCLCVPAYIQRGSIVAVGNLFASCSTTSPVLTLTKSKMVGAILSFSFPKWWHKTLALLQWTWFLKHGMNRLHNVVLCCVLVFACAEVYELGLFVQSLQKTFVSKKHTCTKLVCLLIHHSSQNCWAMCKTKVINHTTLCENDTCYITSHWACENPLPNDCFLVAHWEVNKEASQQTHEMVALKITTKRTPNYYC